MDNRCCGGITICRVDWSRWYLSPGREQEAHLGAGTRPSPLEVCVQCVRPLYHGTCGPHIGPRLSGNLDSLTSSTWTWQNLTAGYAVGKFNVSRLCHTHVLSMHARREGGGRRPVPNPGSRRKRVWHRVPSGTWSICSKNMARVILFGGILTGGWVSLGA